MGSITALQEYAVNSLSFVSQRLPSKLHKITALAIAILALSLASGLLRYVFRNINDESIDYSKFPNNCESLDKVIMYLQTLPDVDQTFKNDLPSFKKIIENIYKTSSNLVYGGGQKQEICSADLPNPSRYADKSKEEEFTQAIKIIQEAFSNLNLLLTYSLGDCIYDPSYNHQPATQTIYMNISYPKDNLLIKLMKNLKPMIDKSISNLKPSASKDISEENISFRLSPEDVDSCWTNNKIERALRFFENQYPNYSLLYSLNDLDLKVSLKKIQNT